MATKRSRQQGTGRFISAEDAEWSASEIAERGVPTDEVWREVALAQAEKRSRKSKRWELHSTLTDVSGKRWTKELHTYVVTYIDGEPADPSDERQLAAMEALLERYDDEGGWRVWVNTTTSDDEGRRHVGGSRIGSPADARGYVNSSVFRRYGFKDDEAPVRVRYEVVAIRSETKTKGKTKRVSSSSESGSRGVRLRGVGMGKPSRVRPAVGSKGKKTVGRRRRRAKQAPGKSRSSSARKNGKRRR